MVWDFIIISFILLRLESKILKKHYLLLSPYTMFIISFNFVFTMPVFILGVDPELNRLSWLSEQEINQSLLWVRVFFYTWCSLAIWNLKKLKYYAQKHNIESVRLSGKLTNNFVFVFTMIYLILYFLLEGAMVGYSPLMMIDRLFNSRKYLELISGFGAVNVLLYALKIAGCIVGCRYYLERKTTSSFFVMLFYGLMSILVGAKRDMLYFVIIFLLMWQKTKGCGRASFSKLILVFCTLFLVMVTSFYIIFSQTLDNVSLQSSVNDIFGYSMELYNFTRMINIFTWDVEYTLIGIADLLISGIPSAIWTAKPVLDYFPLFWRPVLEPNVVSYHTSTYSCLAHGYMMFGNMAPVVYAFLMVFLCQQVYKILLKSDSMWSFAYGTYLVCQVYYFLRAGFPGIVVWTMIINMIVYWFLFKFVYAFVKK